MLGRISNICHLASVFEDLINVDPSERAVYASMCEGWLHQIKIETRELVDELTQIAVNSELVDDKLDQWYHQTSEGSTELTEFWKELENKKEAALQNCPNSKK